MKHQDNSNIVLDVYPNLFITFSARKRTIAR